LSLRAFLTFCQYGHQRSYTTGRDSLSHLRIVWLPSNPPNRHLTSHLRAHLRTDTEMSHEVILARKQCYQR
jgi:hypothetical protein